MYNHMITVITASLYYFISIALLYKVSCTFPYSKSNDGATEKQNTLIYRDKDIHRKQYNSFNND